MCTWQAFGGQGRLLQGLISHKPGTVLLHEISIFQCLHQFRPAVSAVFSGVEEHNEAGELG